MVFHQTRPRTKTNNWRIVAFSFTLFLDFISREHFTGRPWFCKPLVTNSIIFPSSNYCATESDWCPTMYACRIWTGGDMSSNVIFCMSQSVSLPYVVDIICYNWQELVLNSSQAPEVSKDCTYIMLNSTEMCLRELFAMGLGFVCFTQYSHCEKRCQEFIGHIRS